MFPVDIYGLKPAKEKRSIYTIRGQAIVKNNNIVQKSKKKSANEVIYSWNFRIPSWNENKFYLEIFLNLYLPFPGKPRPDLESNKKSLSSLLSYIRYRSSLFFFLFLFFRISQVV